VGSGYRVAGWLGRIELVLLSVGSLVEFFESGLLEWDELVLGVNRVLENGGFRSVGVAFEDALSTWDDVYASYDSGVIFLSPLLRGLPRKYLGRAFLHEVMHHIINSKPPTKFMRVLTRRTQSALALIIPALLGAALVTYALVSVIPHPLFYVLTTLILGLATPIGAMLLLATKEEALARSLTYYAITGTWKNDWVTTEEIFNADWSILNNEKTNLVSRSPQTSH
jgi:hypothetical protein